MGYYSDVAVMMRKKDYEKLVAEIFSAESLCNDDYTTQESKEYGLQFLQRGYNHPDVLKYNYSSEVFVRLCWTDVKWYTSIPYIALIEQYFYDHKVDFVRIGEEASDIEEHYGLQRYEVEIIRTLSFC